jgi:NAD(P)-dependent dehydrogenase (short-subunit alcohol dehydrogenase family)
MTRTAIVTGGSRGIGLAIAAALVKDGASVVVTGRDKSKLDAGVAELARAGDASRVHGVVTDVRDRTAVDALVADTERRFGRLDILVNNAGLGIFADVANMTDEDWRRQIDTNLTGVFYSTRAAIPAMRRAGGGWIVNIASLAGRNYFAGGAAYCATKAGLVAFSEAVMQEVRHDNIRVTVIMPGSVATEFNGRAVSAADSWKLAPDDVAQCVMDLLRHPGRSLPSKVEIRPSRPLK